MSVSPFSTMPFRSRILALVLLLPWGIASLSGVPVEPDMRKIDPVLIATDTPAVTAIQRKISGSPPRAEAPVPLFFRLERDDPSFPDQVRELGGSAQKVAPRLYTGQIPRDAARYLSNRPEVAYLEAARRARPLLDISAPSVSADIVQAGSAEWPTPFNTGIFGNNVYVGGVDSGLDDDHMDFHTGGTGSPSRVVHRYTSPQLPPAESNPLTDEAGHGTHVMGIAAGNGFSSGGAYTGMAPAPLLLFGKTSFFTSDIVQAVSDLLSFAQTTPVSINLSLGLATGPHDGTSGFEYSINSLATGISGSRRLIVAAAGNERTDGEHFRATMPPFGIVTAFLTLEDTAGATAEFWADGEDRYTVTATLGSESITVASGTSSSTGRISVSNRTSIPPNGATFISVFFLPQNSGQTGSIRLTRTRNGGTGTVDGYIDWRDGTFDTPTESGTVTEPANGENVIAVGSYNTKTGPFHTGPIGAISTFSSLGPTRDGRTKPDLAAPGSFLWSTRSFDAFPMNYYGLVPGNDNYAILAGTSMAAPHVTGIAALVWESNPALTGTQMRERIRRTANPPPGAPDNTWGQGKVNAFRAVAESVASITAPAIALPGSTVVLASENSSGAFGIPLNGYAWSLTPPAGSSATLAGASSSSASFLPDIPGIYRVDLTVSQSDPAGTVAGSATKFLRANHIPVAAILGPSSSDNTAPVEFQGSASDLDSGQPKTFHWILVSRPAGSTATSLAPSGVEDAILSPDVAGSYEVGLRVDDGLDSSALVTKIYTAGTVPSDSGGGGGSCSILPARSLEPVPAPLSGPFLFLLPLAVLGIRRTAGKILRERNR